MALSNAIRPLVGATRRSLWSSSFIQAEASTSTAPPKAPSPADFGDLAAITSAASSSAPGAFASPAGSSTNLQSLPRSARGFAYDALPPKVDPTLDLFTNLLMKHGRKAEAQGRVSKILSLIQSASNSPPLPLLSSAIIAASPALRMLSMRKRAKRVETPRALNERQRTRQGIMWILRAAERGRKSGAPREQRIAGEVLAVLEGTSDVFKWVEERHKVATANRSNVDAR